MKETCFFPPSWTQPLPVACIHQATWPTWKTSFLQWCRIGKYTPQFWLKLYLFIYISGGQENSLRILVWIMTLQERYYLLFNCQDISLSLWHALKTKVPLRVQNVNSRPKLPRVKFGNIGPDLIITKRNVSKLRKWRGQTKKSAKISLF